MTRTTRGVLLALGAALISGVSVFVNSYGVKRFGDATAYTTGKNTIAGLALLLAVPLAGRVTARAALTRPHSGREIAGLAAIAVVGGSVPFVLFFEGLAQIHHGALQAQFLNKTLVVWVALLAVVVLRERVGLLQLAAVAVLVVGQAKLSGGFAAIRDMPFGRGEWLILAATLLWAVEVVLAKTLLRTISSSTLALTRMVGGSVLLLGWLGVGGKFHLLVHMDAQQWRWVLITGVLLAGYVATWLAALALAPAVTVTAVLVAAVPVTAVLQAVVKHTALRPQLGGLALVVIGCVLVLGGALARPRPRAVAVAD